MSIKSEQSTVSAEITKPPLSFKRLNRRTFLQLTAATGVALAGEAIRPNAVTSVRAQSSEADTEQESTVENLKKQRQEFLRQIEEKIDLAVMVTLEYLRATHQFTIEPGEWSLEQESAQNPLSNVHRIMQLLTTQIELINATYKNPDYLTVFYDEKTESKSYALAEPQKYIFNENIEYKDIEKWQEIIGSLVGILLPTQKERIRIVNMTDITAAKMIAGEVNLDISREVDKESFKRCVHELFHMISLTPKFIFNDLIGTPDNFLFFAGSSYSVMADNFNDWIVLLREEFPFMNDKFFTQEGDDLKNRIIAQGGDGILTSIVEIEAMLLTDTLCEDITVFESYPPRIQELLLKTLGQGLYVQEVDRVFTREDLLKLRAQLAAVSQGVIPMPETEPTSPPTEDVATPEEAEAKEEGLLEGMRGNAVDKDSSTKGSIMARIKKKIGGIFSKKK